MYVPRPHPSRSPRSNRCSNSRRVVRRVAAGLSPDRFPLLAALSAVVLAGCMGTGGRGDNPLDESRVDQVELLVQNHNFNQATIYTSYEQGGRRLGIVKGKSEATFKFDWPLPYIQLRVKYLAGPETLTERLDVSANDVLELILPAG